MRLLLLKDNLIRHDSGGSDSHQLEQTRTKGCGVRCSAPVFIQPELMEKVGKGAGLLSKGEARLLVNENSDGVNGWRRHCSCCEWQVLTLGDAVFISSFPSCGSAAPPHGGEIQNFWQTSLLSGQQCCVSVWCVLRLEM